MYNIYCKLYYQKRSYSIIAKTATKTEIQETAMLDRTMEQVFDWAKDDKRPIRVAIWNYQMEKDGHDTMKTADDVKWELKASDDELKKFVEDNLKK